MKKEEAKRKEVQKELEDLKKHDSISITFVVNGKLMHITYVCLDDCYVQPIIT